MNIYKTVATYNGISTSSTPDRVSWQASQTEASKARSAAKAEGYKAETMTVNFPTAKGPLLEWLNENVKA